MKKKLSKSRAAYFLIGGSVAALVLITTIKKKKWRYGLLKFAGSKIFNEFKTCTKIEKKLPFRSIPEKSRTISVNGIQIRWEEYGEASKNELPVIMVHGLPTNPRAWRYVLPLLTKKGIRCLAWEQVGFGKSLKEGLTRDISIPKQAEYLYDWLQKLGIKRAVFVGHDYGGGVLQQLIVNHPNIAAGLVLTDVVAYGNWPVMAIRMAQLMNPLIENMPPGLLKPFLKAGITNLGHENMAIKRESLRLYLKPYQSTVGPKAFAHQLRHFNSEDTQRLGMRLNEENWSNLPIRVIWGEKDPLGISSGKKLAKALNAPFIEISGGKHFTIEDHPDIIAEAVLDVLSKIS